MDGHGIPPTLRQFYAEGRPGRPTGDHWVSLQLPSGVVGQVYTPEAALDLDEELRAEEDEEQAEQLDAWFAFAQDVEDQVWLLHRKSGHIIRVPRYPLSLEDATVIAESWDDLWERSDVVDD